MHHCKTVLICLSFIILFASTGNAQRSQFLKIAGSFYYFSYSEELPSPLKSDEKAWLPGGKIAYGYQGTDVPLFGIISYEYTQAKTDYDGTTQQGDPLQLKSKHTLMRGEVDFGYSFKNIGGSSFELSPYAGVDYRYWERLVGDTDPKGYREVYSWWDIPVGIRAGFSAMDSWRIACDISARIMFNGNINFDFASGNASLNSPNAQLGNIVGVKVAVPMDIQLTPGFVMVLSPWYERSAIGQSNDIIITQNGNPVATAHEPNSTTNQTGVDAGVKWEF